MDGLPLVSIWLLEVVRYDGDNAHDSNVTNIVDSSSTTGKPVRMPWLCVLCKMCDVRVCIGIVILSAVAFIAIIITILILMH